MVILPDNVEKSVLEEPTDVGAHGGGGVVAKKYQVIEFKQVFIRKLNGLLVVSVVVAKMKANA